MKNVDNKGGVGSANASAWALSATSAFLALVVTLVTALVQVYSAWYLADDDRRGAFHATVALFSAAMVLVVLSADLLWVLAAMGHGDDLALVDANHPAQTIASSTTSGRLIRLPSPVAMITSKLAVWPLPSSPSLNALRTPMAAPFGTIGKVTERAMARPPGWPHSTASSVPSGPPAPSRPASPTSSARRWARRSATPCGSPIRRATARSSN